MIDLKLSSYDYDLPTDLIAERPVSDRHSSRLLVYDQAKDEIFHSTFSELDKFLPANSTLVFNRSKVFPCRLLGFKKTGGEVEVFLLSLINKNGLYPAMIRASGKRKVGEKFYFGELVFSLEQVVGDGTFLIKSSFSEIDLLKTLEEIGKIPIPPYIRGGESDELDKLSYQTVFAKELGSVAAPTAGLHFSEDLLKKLTSSGHQMASVTLHVGAGTFAPVKVENILEHKMHEEVFTIDENNLKIINESKFRVAVGTTTLRTLESSWKDNRIFFDPKNGLKSTSIFLHPGKDVHSIDALVTNFHLPKSTLLMLVSALIGREKVLGIYKIAVDKKYRFFSYGDGMLILRNARR